MATLSGTSNIDEYLRERLMPVEGAIPHLPGLEMYGNSIPAGTVGGDLFEYINFQQRLRHRGTHSARPEAVQGVPRSALTRHSAAEFG
jgi:hypothetical protein